MGRIHDILIKAEANFQKQENRHDSNDDFEAQLRRLALTKEKIQKKNIYALHRSLILLNEWIDTLDKNFKRDAQKMVRLSSKPPNRRIISVLSDLRKYALERYSALINKKKIENIRIQLSLIEDKKLRGKIEKNLLQIELKDQIILQEYPKLDRILQKYRL